MRHRPHLHLPGPWDGSEIPAPAPTVTHLERVLRVAPGSPVTYTDGAGVVGIGEWTGSAVVRGDEHRVAARSRTVTIAVAPPRSKERQRYVVEKLQELDVARLLWLESARSQFAPPRGPRTRSWATAALEQSRGGRLMDIGRTHLHELEDAVVLDVESESPLRWPDDADSVTVVVGPEGGLTTGERSLWPTANLGPTILRTETAAVVAAGILSLG